MKKVLIFLFILFFISFPAFTLTAGGVEINMASPQQLETLTGIGPVKAQAIIDARPFSSVDDLLRVKGIGEKTLQKIKDQGLAYVGESNSSLRGGQQSDAAISNNEIASSPEAPRNDVSVTYPSGVFINEILPNSEGADEENEFIEVYNSNNFDVDLGGWQIKDTKGTSTTFTITKSTKILANGFLVFKRPETKIMLNNDNDGLNLLTPDAKIVDSVTFTKAPLNQSYNKTSTGWAWSTTLTPEAKNIIAAVVAKTSTKSLPKAKKTDNNKIELATADLSLPVQAGGVASPWVLFFTALAITIISATLVLFIRIRFKNLKI